MGDAAKKHRWVFGADVSDINLGGGVTRRVLAHGPEAMCATHYFEKGAIVALHSHPHTQITYVAEGVFEFTVDGESKVVKKGDSILKQDSVPHCATCLEKGVLIDFFTPMREDFV